MNNLTALKDFGFLTVTGRDAQKFLQGYTTCDLEDITEHEVRAGAICNIKGRMVCNFLVCREPEGFLLRHKLNLIAPTIAFLGKYIVFSKATLEDCSEKLRCYGSMNAEDNFPQTLHEISVIPAGRALNLGAHRTEIWSQETLQADQDDSLWVAEELKAGVVWVDDITTEEYIPQMFNLHGLGGISFEKGCYLGQEIVARMQYRGELKNRLHIGQSKEVLPIGTKVLNTEGKAAGAVVGAANGIFAAVLRIDQSGYQLADGTSLETSLIA
jgi:folate-binding protein YgfZ